MIIGGQDRGKYLADALGITVEKLQAAMETAAKAEQAQADQILSQPQPGMFGGPGGPGGPGRGPRQ